MRGTFAAYFGFSPGDITVFAGDNGGKSSAVVPPAPARMLAKSYAAIADHVLTLLWHRRQRQARLPRRVRR